MTIFPLFSSVLAYDVDATHDQHSTYFSLTAKKPVSRIRRFHFARSTTPQPPLNHYFIDLPAIHLP
jgi:hypothetical protein